MKLVSVVGARPQFIKAFTVSRALEDRHEEVLVHTGQHYDHEMSQVFFEELDLPEPAYNLGIGSDEPGAQTGRMMAAFEPVLAREAPDAVVVYGDTNSTLAAAIVAAKAEPLLAHVEAGLRSDNRAMPEEHNRVLTDHAADVLLAPTDRAFDRLHREGLGERTVQTGDVMYDALLWARERTDRIDAAVLPPTAEEGPYLLATVHRASNTDDLDRLRMIVDALVERTERVVFPAHPRTVEAMDRAGVLERARSHLAVVEPVSYLGFVRLLDRATAIVTDSGGVQKEAFFLDTPCVTLRAETEWPETVEAGWNVLVDADAAAIHRAIDDADRQRPLAKPEPFGGGDAAHRVVRALEAAVHGLETPPA